MKNAVVLEQAVTNGFFCGILYIVCVYCLGSDWRIFCFCMVRAENQTSKSTEWRSLWNY